MREQVSLEFDERESTAAMDSKSLSASNVSNSNPTDTYVDQDKYATTHQNSTAATPVWMKLKMGADLPLSFGRYEVLRVLGEGAMAAVYLAEDKQLGRQVAIKIPKFEPGDAAGMKRFFREARAMATLRHPHLCPVYDVSEVEGINYFTMAYIEGGTLADRITSDAPMANRHVAIMIAKTASALHAAHQTGTVHRDLKPANIMVDLNNEPVVMDFGLAGLVDAESSLTRSGEMIGTPAYMSPEQITGNLNAIGPVSDVYSLGAIMYEMLTGQLPYGGTVAEVVQRALTAEPKAPSTIHGDVDPALEAICLQAMSHDPDKRYASAEGLAVALRNFLRKPTAPPVSNSEQQSAQQHSNQAHWESQASQVRGLWRAEQFAEALALLNELSSLTEPAAASYAEWAQQEIPKVRSQIEQANKSIARSRVNAKIAKPYQENVLAKNSSLPIWAAWVGIAAIVAFVSCFGYLLLFNSMDSSKQSVTGNRPAGDVTNSKMASPAAAHRIDNQPSRTRVNSTNSRDGGLPGNSGDSFTSPPDTLDDPREFHSPPPRRDVDGILQDLDTNKDGQLSLSEIPTPQRPHLMRADTDKNGIVTREELDIMFLFTPGPPPPRR